MTVRTRFAPSPTGSLHVGGARTALYCLLHARKHGGKFMLRIEDTDQARSTAEAAAGILRDMRWLGMQWDEGPEVGGPAEPYFQSQRLDTYDKHLEQLLAADLAYEAWDTPTELTAAREAARAEKRNFRYRRQPVSPEQENAWRDEGREPILRFTAPDHAFHMHDLVLGEVSVAVEELEDIVVRKRDGFPTYHFAVVVDDHLMGVNMVLRGQEHLLNTPKHLGLYEALGWQPPQYAHLPIIFNPGGGKMSKRDKAKAARAAAREAHKALGAEDYTWLIEATGAEHQEVVRFMKKKNDSVDLAEAIAAHLDVELPMIEVMDFRKGGYLPEGLLNYLALLGWSAGDDREKYTMDELIEAFDLGRVNNTAARFDPLKLDAMNASHIRTATIDRLCDAQDAYLEVAPDSPFHGMSEPLRRRYIFLFQQRMTTFVDLEAKAGFFFSRPTTWQAKAVAKHLTKGGGIERLAELRPAIEALTFTVEDIEAGLAAWANERELGMGKVAQPIRVAISGAAATPGIGDTLQLLGKEETLARIDACLAWYAAQA